MADWYTLGAGSSARSVSVSNSIVNGVYTSNRSIVVNGNGDDIFYSAVATTTTVDANEGIDTVVFGAARSSYSVQFIDTGVTVTRAVARSTDNLVSVERLQFTDGTLAIDIDGNAGQAYRLYQSAFDRAPDLQGLNFWIDHLDSGESLSWVADRFIDSDEFGILYGENVSNAAFVSALYQNILGREGDEGGVAYWNAELDSGNRSRTDVLIGFSESEENIVGVAPSISDGIWLG